MKQLPAICAAAWMMAVTSAFAHDEPSEEPSGPWSGLVSAGYSEISGNTESQSITFNTEVHYDAGRWHHEFRGFAVGRSEEDDTTGELNTTAEAYKAAFESKLDLSRKTYAFGLVEYNKDRFSSYDHQLYEIVGLGRRFINTDEHILLGQAGIGAGQNELSDGTEENEFTTRLSADYTWNFSDNASFSQILNYTIASSNKFTESISEVRTRMLGNLNLLVSYTIKSNSDVLPATESTDRYTTVSVEYQF